MWDLISGAQLDEYLDQERGCFWWICGMHVPTAGHISGCCEYSVRRTAARIGELPQESLIVLYCYHGPNSMRAARWLASLGYETADVYGGIQAYRGKYLEWDHNADFWERYFRVMISVMISAEVFVDKFMAGNKITVLIPRKDEENTL